MAKKDFKKNTAELFLSDAEPEAPKAKQKGTSIPKGYRLAKEYKSERLQLLIRPTTKEGLKEEATAQGISLNDLANNIFEEYLERTGKA